MKLAGGCYCGGVRYEADGDPLFKGQCHCRECQYISGGSPNVTMGMPAASFAYTKGAPKPFQRGDLDSSGQSDTTDVSRLLVYLFASGPGLPCHKAADTNDDGRLNLSRALPEMAAGTSGLEDLATEITDVANRRVWTAAELSELERTNIERALENSGGKVDLTDWEQMLTVSMGISGLIPVACAAWQFKQLFKARQARHRRRTMEQSLEVKQKKSAKHSNKGPKTIVEENSEAETSDGDVTEMRDNPLMHRKDDGFAVPAGAEESKKKNDDDEEMNAHELHIL